ncbi:outer membrane beta-barrel protein [Mucilaginibacter sp. L3T2-6]|nr:outer membrane beta-barrel protein [Mucilaginibacter sp. L3T2-6]MDO3641304.1 outer membrane beta-barrel protein [Mucilaginibacter sp. L3T2-6]MDV6213936.1 outer membrane beta-barrel protein [Mucilaginibacter sp. L3T2-6]
MNAGFNLYAYGNLYYSFSNDVVNRTKSSSYIVQGTISKSVEDKFDIYLNAGPGYVVSQSSLQSANNNGKSFNADGGLTIYFPGKIQFSSDAQYTYLAKTQIFDRSFHQVLLNATLARKFFKKENLQLALSGNDLLNQNTGFNRVANYNVIQQTQESTIRRYIKLAVIWNFTHEGGASGQN